MPGKMAMMHVRNVHPSGAVLDPSAPDMLMYALQGDGAWKLVGVMYLADGAYPERRPLRAVRSLAGTTTPAWPCGTWGCMCSSFRVTT